MCRGGGGKASLRSLMEANSGFQMSGWCTIDTKVIDKPDHYNGDPTQVRRLVGQAQVVHGCCRLSVLAAFADAEQSAVPIRKATREITDATLSAQLCYVLVMLSTDTLDKCHNAGINEGLKDVAPGHS